MDQLIRKKDNGRVKIITGLRRSGKSYLLFNLYRQYLLDQGIKEDQIVGLALDEIDNAQYRNRRFFSGRELYLLTSLFVKKEGSRR